MSAVAKRTLPWFRRLATGPPRHDSLSRTRCNRCLVSAYRWSRARRAILAVALRLEGGEMCSGTLRDVLRRYHGVDVGAYSYGPCLRPTGFPPEVTVGRYVSVAPDVHVYRRHHPLTHLSLHPYFYNPALGIVSSYRVDSVPLEIGDDVWVGAGAIILPGCRVVGLGAAIAAGAVVTHDVPPFSVVAGNPARVIKMRFSAEVCEQLVRSRWWERPIEDLADYVDIFTTEISEEFARRIPEMLGR